MAEDEFTKLYKYLQKEFTVTRQEMRDGFEKTNARVNSLHGAVDSAQKRTETDEQERLFANRQIDRHEGWIKQLAANTKTKLVPEP